MKHLHEISNALQIKILPNGLLSDYQHIPRPTLFLQMSFLICVLGEIHRITISVFRTKLV